MKFWICVPFIALSMDIVLGYAPKVKILSPDTNRLQGSSVTVTWIASDKGGDQMTFDLDFSANGGVSWIPIARNIREPFYDVALKNLGPTTDGLFRVRASDGFASALTTSEYFFSTPYQTPTVSVSYPPEGTKYVGDEQVHLIVDIHVESQEDDVDSEDIKWVSSLDGDLGQGENLVVSASDLSEGDHSIEVTVTDTYGYVVKATRTIRVRRSTRTNAVNAVCQEVEVEAEEGLCTATASVDANSFDTNGASVSIRQDPEGPYPEGETSVTLTVTNEGGDKATCLGHVTVIDTQRPVSSASLILVDEYEGTSRQGLFKIHAHCDDNCERVEMTATLNDLPVNDGDIVMLTVGHDDETIMEDFEGADLTITAPNFLLSVICVHATWNVDTATAKSNLCEYCEPEKEIAELHCGRRLRSRGNRPLVPICHLGGTICVSQSSWVESHCGSYSEDHCGPCT